LNLLELKQQAGIQDNPDQEGLDLFAELIVKECCLALWTEECHTSDLAFDEVKRNATRIKEHFGIDPNEITEDMLARSIKWMEQQLVDKKHFGVAE
jgi:hypothetical protein